MTKDEHNVQETPVSEPYTIYTTFQKSLIVFLVAGISTLSGFGINIYYPAIPSIAHDLGVTTELVNLTVTSYMIFQGLSPTLWGALADVKGRRLTYILTMTILTGANIGLALTRSYVQLLVLRCLQSTGSASTIALGAGVVGDISTREERGGFMGYYQAGLLLPSAIGPFIGGILAEKLGWKSIFWFLTIVGALFSAVLFILLPETLRLLAGNGSKPVSGLAKSPLATLQRKRYERATGRVRTYEAPTKSLLESIDLLGPLKILFGLNGSFPILFVAVHYTGWQMMLTSLPTVFEQTYGLSSLQVGLVFLANGLGSIIGTVTTGRILDLDYAKIKRSSAERGVEIPLEKARLRTLYMWSGLICVSTLGFGWTIDKHVHVAAPIIFTFVLGWAAISNHMIVTTFLVDIYPKRSASAAAALNFGRCLMGAGGTAAVGPLIARIGVGWTFTMMVGLMILSDGLIVLQMIYGPIWRRRIEQDTDE